MANLFFPQLQSGALAQYPIKRVIAQRNVVNAMMDGSCYAASDPEGALLLMELQYVSLEAGDLGALQNHFQSCSGSFRAFTFLDPTDNLLSFSSDLTRSSWALDTGLTIQAGGAGPDVDAAAWTLTNSSQVDRSLSQTLPIPTQYQYCFSVYARSIAATSVALSRSGTTTVAVQDFVVGPTWTRLVSSGKLSESGETFRLALSVPPGQQIQVFGPQLEAQPSASRYRPTLGWGGVYTQAHWASSELPIVAEAPGLYAVSCAVETTIWRQER